MTMTILIVDDDKEIAELVEIYLIGEGYQVFKAYHAKEALEILSKEEVHLVILDIMMPGIDGIQLCKQIRVDNAVPIIMLSAKSTDDDKINGLATGADDYVTKPFNPLELLARVKSQLRRYTQFNSGQSTDKQEKIIQLENLNINRETHSVRSYDREVKLTPIEFEILFLLASNKGKVFSTEEIFERVWNEKIFEANNTVMVHIRRIREKIELDSREVQIIKTVWGVGYKID
ncbi:DNA-binding response regulator, OmpR family, contains REC and winged-helix (wHTH) domain [Anaerosporobacter mobilis DSM 15930]|uniref:Stage 0 sporulation protein A homolog n=1 Tax=Anaerosporobacter mobilis DSM 15930 TaxID=1120996 RepID=A0A1M7LBL5_9FIRM|nr:response regulator transcription factor [Anaerosporobacter mobilis]SHM75502.1 DNA-binding response regulator, OmpR family, contains REC and winged-helix (wHTH) domain [Anaerosporobacter mobilis DSM 15930]